MDKNKKESLGYENGKRELDGLNLTRFKCPNCDNEIVTIIWVDDEDLDNNNLIRFAKSEHENCENCNQKLSWDIKYEDLYNS